MTATSKSFNTILDSQIAPDAPIDTTLLTAIRDSLVQLHEWMGYSYYAGAVQNHNHDGVNSASVPIGPNSLRNGSFESGTSGWTLTPYSGGTVATNTANAMDGATCLAISSTVLANGGGVAQTTEYEVCAAGRMYSIRGLIMASVANISSKAEVVWFDSGFNQISLSTVFTSTNTPIVKTEIGTEVSAPTNAKYKQLRITGGVPGTGTAVGTVYFDGLIAMKPIAGLIKFTVITASNAAWTPDPSTTRIVVACMGGGQSGGANNASYGNGGKAAPGFNFGVISPVTAATYNAVVGAGGASASAANGNPGGTSSFGGIAVALGASSLATGPETWGLNGTGLTTAGQASQLGAGGAAGAAAAANTGAGGGSGVGAASGAGGSGVIYVWEYA